MQNIAITAAYPINIYICVDGMNGYADLNGVVTNRLVAYQLKSVTYNQTTPQTLNLTYKSDRVKWILPYTFNTNLSFRVFYDDNTLAQTTPLPFEFPLMVQFERNPF